MPKIKAVVSDVDGVMVGKQEGVNFPLPHPDVLRALEKLSAQSIPVVLCTAKFSYAIKDIALKAKLNNPHITDGGAYVVDWLDNKVVASHAIDKETVQLYARSCVNKNIYTELYTAEDYYVQASQADDFTLRRSKVLQREPQIVDSLVELAQRQEVIKLISFSEGEHDVSKLEKNIKLFDGQVNYIWSQHPYLKPRQIMILTAPGVSKGHAVEEVAASLGIGLDSILGIGDSQADWSFMELCGYNATIGKETGKLKNLTATKGKGHYYHAASVDDHGLLEAFKYFGLS